jgi:hypothetical protein
MIEINNEQRKWLKTNFALTSKDLPTDFYIANDLIDIINGIGGFRGVEYSGNGYSFIDDCIMAFTFSNANYEKFPRLFNQLCYLINECETSEYYELMHNLNVIKLSLLSALSIIQEQELESVVNKLICDCGLILESELPF